MKGKISLVGAGLGDPELLTVKALRKIQEADVVVYDRLINPVILNSCKEDCEKIYVGKNPKHHPVPQQQIEELLIKKAEEGKEVVRLKSGDPYVFGRGGEEGTHLRREKIEFEIIPGITSAIGGLAYAGIPITHRDYASSFHVYTGHLKSTESEIDWQRAATAEGTLIFLMGMSELKTITEALLQNGKSPDCPAAVIQWAGRKQQKTVVGTLGNIYSQAAKARLEPPSLIVIGEVVKLREELNFFEEKLLFGQSVALPYTETKTMYAKLTDSGAEVIELAKPAIKILPSAIDIHRYQQLVFFDKQSVAVFIQKMLDENLDWRELNDKRIIALGQQTQLALLDKGICPDESYHLVKDFAEKLPQHEEALLLGDAFSMEDLLEETGDPMLFRRFWITHETKLQVAEESWQEADYLYFPSSKSARIFLQHLPEEQVKALANKKIIVMGAATKTVFAKVQIPVIQTAEASFESVIEQLIKEVNR